MFPCSLMPFPLGSLLTLAGSALRSLWRGLKQRLLNSAYGDIYFGGSRQLLSQATRGAANPDRPRAFWSYYWHHEPLHRYQNLR